MNRTLHTPVQLGILIFKPVKPYTRTCGRMYVPHMSSNFAEGRKEYLNLSSHTLAKLTKLHTIYKSNGNTEIPMVVKVAELKYDSM